MAAIVDPGPIAQGFGQTPQLIITQGYAPGGSPPPPPKPLGTGGIVVTYIPLNR